MFKYMAPIRAKVCAVLIFTLLFSAVMQFNISNSKASAYPDPLPVYPEISQSQLMELIKDTTSDGHPYLFGRKADFERVREYAFGKDEFLTSLYQSVKDEASYYIGKEPVIIKTDIQNNSYLSRATSAFTIVRLCSLVYLVENDEAYAERAYAEALYFAKDLESWGHAQSLDNNHTALAVALCYDWLYDWLGQERRTILSDALFEKHLNELYDLFSYPDKKEYKWSFHQAYFGSNNHAVLDNTSAFVEALAVCDADSEKSTFIMAATLQNLTKENGPFDRLYPDSGWYEGGGYWSYVGPYMARMFSSMESAFGSTLGFEDNPYITGVSYFPIYTQSRLCRFIYSDAYRGITKSGAMYYFAKMSGDDALKKYVIDNKIYSEPLLCLWYEVGKEYDDNISLSKDKLFRNIDLATMRSSWESADEIFTGMAVQAPKETHAFMAAGTIVLDAYGENWITNPGKENYGVGSYFDNAQDGTRWDYYSTRAEANSCVVINPGEDGGQIVGTPDTITDFQTGDDMAFTVADLSNTYDGVTSYVRGLKLYDNRSKVMLQDEISLIDTSDVYSFINVYKSDLYISDDGSYAILSKGNKHIYVKIISNKPYQLTTYEAASTALGTSPSPDGQTDFTEDYERLAVRYDDISGDIRLTVIFVPYLSDNIPEIDDYQTAVSEWTIQNNAADKPILTSLSINGKALDGFRSDTCYYSVPMEFFEAKIEAKAKEGCSVEIKSNYVDFCHDIYVTDNVTGEKNHYMIDVVLQGSIIGDTYVGGHYSSEGITKSENYGDSADVILTNPGKYGTTAYYKLKAPYIPKGKAVSNADLSLMQYSVAENGRDDSFNFFVLSEDVWQEDTVTFDNAPLKHQYNDTWYNYIKADGNGEYREVDADMYLIQTEVKRVSRATGLADRFYEQKNYNITPLIQKLGPACFHSHNNIFSVVFGFRKVDGLYSSSGTHYIASKENPNEALRPNVYFSVTNDRNASYGVIAENPKFVDVGADSELYYQSQNISLKTNDEFTAITYAANLSSQENANINLIVAQYNSDGQLVDIDITSQQLLPKESTTIRTNKLTFKDRAKSVKTFIWTDSIVPLSEYSAIDNKQ